MSVANPNVECLVFPKGGGGWGHWYHAKIGLGEVRAERKDKAYDENDHDDGLGGCFNDDLSRQLYITQKIQKLQYPFCDFLTFNRSSGNS
jgi:hypothetical protein